MKKSRIILCAVALVALAGSAFGLKSNRFSCNLYTMTTGTCRLVKCSTQNKGLGLCPITVPLYTQTTGTCKIYTGQRFKCED